MNKVTTIHLHGRSYTIEESGYEALSSYLSDARTHLESNPDKEEIIQDLEQAIADKADRYVHMHKNVLLASEVNEIIREMGPVGTSQSETTAEHTDSKETPAPKKLYKISETGVIAGVCSGLAAYFDVDVTLVRVLFVIFTILTHGAGILVYIIMMFVVPNAKTSEDQARAHGIPFTAQEFINRAKAEYKEFSQEDSHWKKKFRDQKKEWKQEWRKTVRENRVRWGDHVTQGTSVFTRVLGVVIGIATAFVTIGFIFALLTLITTHAFIGFMLPTVPLWILIVLLVCVYNIVLWPLRAIRYVLFHHGNPRHHDTHDGWFGFVDGVMWIGIICAIGWLLYTYVPIVHSFADTLPAKVAPVTDKIQAWFQKQNGF